MLTIEKTEKRPAWVNEDGSIDPSKFNSKLYFDAVERAANMSIAEITAHVDAAIDDLYNGYSRHISPDLTETVSIFAYLLSRRKK